jgi:hypothetical protein
MTWAKKCLFFDVTFPRQDNGDRREDHCVAQRDKQSMGAINCDLWGGSYVYIVFI